MRKFSEEILAGIPPILPPLPFLDESIHHAPSRPNCLSQDEKKLAVQNALRYFDAKFHPQLAKEFLEELLTYGHIYMHRFRPRYPMYARPLHEYPHKSLQAACIMLMIQNNLDPNVAQHPHELITYGGNGQVFQNWAQYLLTMKYLATMTDYQTLVLYSGHPLGLFPSHPSAPRVVITNGMVVPNYSKPEDLARMSALGVTQYGQMTAGSFMYIGSQGIVHGTTITMMNAGRRISAQGLRGKIFVSSGLGGMSGAQGKASVIAGAIGVIAEINPLVLEKRRQLGWIQEVFTDIPTLILRIQKAKAFGEAVSLAYLGNIVDLWEAFVKFEVHVDLGSDQTSLHNPFGGGYFPASLSLEASLKMMVNDPPQFKKAVQASIVRQVAAIHEMTKRGMYFFDYGNGFLHEASKAGADVLNNDGTFKFPSYVEDIMGPLCFDHGFGPFRWVCTSGLPSDLALTDELATNVLASMLTTASDDIKPQISDNLQWIQEADKHQLVVGSQARILYANASGRINIAQAFHEAIQSGRISAPVVLGRDHHDVSGADSPFRETSDIRDGSKWTADMSVQNVIGGGFRGATWVSLHNGGGVGWGEAMNGGFGLVLDGSKTSLHQSASLLYWDVHHGIARRSWAGHLGAIASIQHAMEKEPALKVTMPHSVSPTLLKDLF